MKSFQKNWMMALVLLAVATFAVTAVAKDDKADDTKKAEKQRELVVQGWKKICVDVPKNGDKPAGKACGVIERLDMKDPAARLSEVVIGYPDDKSKKDVAVAKVILPLGILLETDITMKVDDAKSVKLKPSFCTNEGCFSFLTLPKDVIDAMMKAKTLSFLFKTADGRDAKLDMGLEGFDKAWKDLG